MSHSADVVSLAKPALLLGVGVGGISDAGREKSEAKYAIEYKLRRDAKKVTAEKI